MPEPITRHEIECIAWRAEHDGWVKTEWKAQHLLNQSTSRRFDLVDTKFSAMGIRISAIEKKVVWVVAITTLFAQLLVGYFFKT